MKNVEFEVHDFQDNGVDYGWYINARLEGFEINGEEDAQNDELNDVFAEFGLNINIRDIVLLQNSGYVDSWDSTFNGRIEEYFFKDKADAEFVAKTLQTLIDTVLKTFK